MTQEIEQNGIKMPDDMIRRFRELKNILLNCEIDLKTNRPIIPKEIAKKIAKLHLFTDDENREILRMTYNDIDIDIDKTPIHMRHSPDSKEWGNVVEAYLRNNYNKYFKQKLETLGLYDEFKDALFRRGDVNTEYDFIDELFNLYHTEVKSAKNENGWYGPNSCNIKKNNFDKDNKKRKPTKYINEESLDNKVFHIFIKHKMILKKYGNEDIVEKLIPTEMHIAYMSVNDWKSHEDGTNGTIDNNIKGNFFHTILAKESISKRSKKK